MNVFECSKCSRNPLRVHNTYSNKGLYSVIQAAGIIKQLPYKLETEQQALSLVGIKVCQEKVTN